MIQFLTRINLGTILLIPVLIAGILLLGEEVQIVGDYYDTKEIVDFGMWGTFHLDIVYNQLIGGFVILLNVILINNIFNRQNLHEHTTLLPGIVYILLLSLTHSFYSFNGDLLFQTFLILSFYPILRYDFNKVNYKLPFNIGFFMGIGATFFPVFYLFFPLFFIIDIILRPFNYRYLMFYISGWLTPQVYLFAYLYFIGKSPIDYLDFWDRLYLVNFSEFMILLDIFVLFLALITTIPATNVIINSVGLKVGKQAKTLMLLGLFSMVISIALFVSYATVAAFQVVVAPMSILLAGAVLKSSRLSFYHSFLTVLMIYCLVKFFFN